MLSRSGEDVVDVINLGFGNLTGSLVEVDSGDFQNNVGKSSANTFDTFKSESCLNVSLDVGILDSQNVSILLVIDNLKSGLNS